MSLEYDDLTTLLRTTLLPDDHGYNELLSRRLTWWDSSRVRSWFLGNGYTLYHRYQYENQDFIVEMYPPDVEPQERAFPYPYEGDMESSSRVSEYRPFHAYIGHKDRSGRHVAVKAILDGSEELRILKYLQKQGVPHSMDGFHNVIPVLDVLSCEGQWLAIMPRIAHGDIKAGNILVNHVSKDFFDDHSRFRRLLRSQGKLTYAFCDFDGSTMFSPSMSLDECRLPSHVSFNTLWYQVPADTSQGEFDFHPFAFDVGMLGVLFCNEFQHLMRVAPMLAPLLDRMTTRDIERRFKASEALRFFEEEVLPQTPEYVLSSWIPQRDSPTGSYDTFDRWAGLDPTFVDKWAAFRESPVPLYLKFLRYICEYPWVFDTVSCIRRVARFIRIRMKFSLLSRS
ncbi:hypothetical protein C0995_001681 [Termitomyces sp. Mi166|nr:hypothetical protein C0995_001681 [Termitomyces sp. Mi166\